jgi:hypothetical protein
VLSEATGEKIFQCRGNIHSETPSQSLSKPSEQIASRPCSGTRLATVYYFKCVVFNKQLRDMKKRQSVTIVYRKKSKE